MNWNAPLLTLIPVNWGTVVSCCVVADADGRVAALVLVGRLVPRHHLVGVRGVRRKPGVLVGRARLPTAVVPAGGQAVEEVLHAAGVAGRRGRHADRRGARGVRRGGPRARVRGRRRRVHHLLRRRRRRGRVTARVLVGRLVPRPHLVGVRRVRRKPRVLVGRAGLPTAVVPAGGQAVEEVLHAAGVAGRRGRHADRRGARGVRRGGPCARVGRRRGRVRHLLRRGRRRCRVTARVLIGRLVPRHHLIGVRRVRRKPGVLVGRAGLPTAVVAAGGQAVEEVLHARSGRWPSWPSC